MQVGTLNRVIRIKRPSVSTVALGRQKAYDWAGPVLLAHKSDISDQEKQSGNEVSGRLQSRFTVHQTAFTRTITTQDLLVCEGKEYAIVGVKEGKTVAPTLRGLSSLEITTATRTDG